MRLVFPHVDRAGNGKTLKQPLALFLPASPHMDGLNATRIANHLGWRRFFQLVWNLPSFFRLFFGLIKDERVALGPKLVIISAMAYLALPTDLVPDFLLGLGQLDDVVILFSALKLFLRLCPPEVVQERLRAIAAGK